MRNSKRDFIRQQGLAAPTSDSHLYDALMFQPRVMGGLITIGTLLQRPAFFAVLSTLLWWSALVPKKNPFTALYNRLLSARYGLALGVAPAPRRFAEGLAGTIAAATAVALLFQATITAWVLQGVFAIAVIQVLAGRFCAGAQLYHVLGNRWAATARALDHTTFSHRGSGDLMRRTR